MSNHRITDFVLVGMPKCGTTSFYKIIGQHSQIEFPESGKSIPYYKRFKNVNEFEKNIWGNVRKRNIKYGICAENWGNINAKEMALNFGDDLQIFFILRNPVERAYSEYKYFYDMGYANFNLRECSDFYKLSHAESFDKYVRTNLHKGNPMFERGKYFEIINPFIKYYGKERVHIIIFEEMLENKEKTYYEAFEFLNVDKEKCDFNLKENEGGNRPRTFLFCFLYMMIDIYILQPLCIGCKTSVHLKQIVRMGEKMRACFRNLCLCKDKDETNILPETYRRLRRFYMRDCVKLGYLMRKDMRKFWFGQ